MPNYDISITVLDGDGDTSILTTHGVFADDATALTRAENLAETMDVLILGQITSVKIAKEVSIGGWTLKSTPDPDSDVEVKGRFVFSLTGLPRSHPKLSIPSFDKATYTTTGGSIPYDLNGSAPVDVFLANLVDNNFSDYRWSDINGVTKAYEAFA